jgi:hypothetical protein
MNLSWAFPLPFQSKQPKKVLPTYSATPHPDEILESHQPATRFQGLKVAWTLTVRNMLSEYSRDEIMVLAKFENQPGSIWLPVDFTKYPDILYSPSGSEIAVKGEIASIRGQDIYLKDCQVVVNS